MTYSRSLIEIVDVPPFCGDRVNLLIKNFKGRGENMASLGVYVVGAAACAVGFVNYEMSRQVRNVVLYVLPFCLGVRELFVVMSSACGWFSSTSKPRS